MLVHETEDEHLGLCHDDVAEREDSGELAVRTDHERVVQMRNRLSLAAHLLEGLRRAELRLEPEELGVHEAAGGVLAVGKKLLDLARLARLHLGEELRGFLLGQIGEQVGGVVRLHLLEDVGSFPRLEGLEELALQLGLDLLQRVRRRFHRKPSEEDGALAAVEILEDLGQIGRMHFRHGAARHVEPDVSWRRSTPRDLRNLRTRPSTSSCQPILRTRPRKPTSTWATRSSPRARKRCRSLTRSTLASSVSTIWRSRTSWASGISLVWSWSGPSASAPRRSRSERESHSCTSAHSTRRTSPRVPCRTRRADTRGYAPAASARRSTMEPSFSPEGPRAARPRSSER